MFEGYRTIRELADSDDHVVPGHDPLVLARYPAPSAELEGVVAALHLVPADLESARIKQFEEQRGES